MLLKYLPLLLLAIVSSACTRTEAGGLLVIIGATLEQPGDAPISPAVVIVEGAKFRNVGSQVTTPIPPGSDKMPAAGATIRQLDGALIRPGLPANLVLTLESGVKKTMKEGRWIE